jgi:hypothetical protein
MHQQPHDSTKGQNEHSLEAGETPPGRTTEHLQQRLFTDLLEQPKLNGSLLPAMLPQRSKTTDILFLSFSF